MANARRYSRKSYRIRRANRRGRPARSLSSFRTRARSRLKAYRQASVLAVAATSFLLLFWESTFAQEANTEESLAEAGDSILGLIQGFSSYLPKVAVALLVFGFGWIVVKAVKFLVHAALGKSPRISSSLALFQIGFFFLATVAAVSVLLGDIRALAGSLGLLGLALSWALQTPIESFTGWVLNAFRSYYRVGDRIEVGEVLGDVYKVDYLTTTVWEIGRPGKAVQGAQPTGALITFPNSEILRANIINYSRDFPFVWEDVTMGFANESDVSYAIRLVRRVAEEVVGQEMQAHVGRYKDLLRREGVAFDVEKEPQVYISLTDSFVNCTVRYLVPIRARRRTSSLLLERLLVECGKPEHQGKIFSGYPRYEIRAATSEEGKKARAG